MSVAQQLHANRRTGGGSNWFGWSGRAAIVLGLVAIFFTAVAGENPASGRFANAALLGITLAIVLGWVGLTWDMRVKAQVRTRASHRPRGSVWAVLAVATLCGVAAQTWFQAGRSIA